MGIKDRKHNNSEDHTLFRDHVGPVKPVISRSRHSPEKPPNPNSIRHKAKQRLAAEDHPAESSPGNFAEYEHDTSFQRRFVSRKRLRELRRGKLNGHHEIDLHGCTRDEAHARLRQFIFACAAQGVISVRVIHGKGQRSGAAGPVLKSAVNHWLREWEPVIAFCPAAQNDGGSGAVYVLLN